MDVERVEEGCDEIAKRFDLDDAGEAEVVADPGRLGDRHRASFRVEDAALAQIGEGVTAALEGAETDRVRIRHVIGGGEASYWIERDQITSIRLVN